MALSHNKSQIKLAQKHHEGKDEADLQAPKYWKTSLKYEKNYSDRMSWKREKYIFQSFA